MKKRHFHFPKNFLLFWIKIANEEKLSIIRNALTLSLPVVMAGAAAVLINNFPIPAYQNLMLKIFGEGWRYFGAYIWNGTLAILSPVTAFSIGYVTAERYNLKNPLNAAHPVISGLLAFCSLLLITEPAANDWAIPYNWMGVNGLFLSIAVSLVSSEIFLLLYRIRFLRIRFVSEDAGSAITHAFAAMVPAILSFCIFAFLKIFTDHLGIRDIHALIYDALSLPFKNMGNTLPAALLFNFARHFLWFLGIHGSNALEPVMNELYVSASEANALAIGAGHAPPFIFTKTFFDTYISMGGAGNTISLLIALFTVRKKNSTRRIAQISLFPAIFNINETLIFGIPIVLNPVYFFPFVASPLVLTVLSWAAVKLGMLPISAAEAAWTTPPLISGFVAAGSIAGSIMQLINLLAAFLIYLPFVHLAERIRKYRYQTNYDELLRAGGKNAIKVLADQSGEIGAISQILANDLLSSIKKNEHSLLKNTPGVTFMLDLGLHFVLGSEKTASLLEYQDIQDMTGLPIEELFSRSMPDSWTANIKDRCLELIETGKAQTLEEKVKIHNRKESVYQVTLTMAEDDDGVCRGIVIVLNDISELSRAREEAMKASQAKGDFLANMSHEMRTPMNAITGMTAIALNTSSPEKKDNCLKNIEEASDHLLAVINDILDMSKIEANMLELSPVNFNFEKLLNETANVLKFRMEERKQHFNLHIERAIPPYLLGDEQRLSQVITNLLSNAVKFTPEEGSIGLNAQLVKREQSLFTIQIGVSDTGIGITPDQQARLFTSYTQADRSTTRKFGGTGLGLAISRRIVEMMGGRIWIQSEPNKGSEFFFTIQLEEGNEKGIEPEEAVDLAPDKNNFSGYCMLLAEDVEINREILISLLEPTGISIESAEDGLGALQMYKATPEKYHIIFMDLQMPEMDGYEATRKIRDYESMLKTRNLNGYLHRQIPIIAMTASVFKEDIEKCLQAGMNSHLGKPLNIDDVVETLRKYLPGKK